MSNSSLVKYTELSPNHSGKRNYNITRITPHCVVGQISIETLGDIFASASKAASSNYGIGADGRVGMYVEEENRSWCSSDSDNDNRSVTIECASTTYHPYAMNNAVYKTLINLCVDICKRNGKTKLLWLGDKNATLKYNQAQNEMVLTVHRWFENKSCPGDWLYSRLGDLANQVTARLQGSKTPKSSEPLYRVQVGAFKNHDNALALEKKLRSKGYDTYVVLADGFIKVQTGAFSKKANAEALAKKLKAEGFDTYITTKAGTKYTARKTVKQLAKEVWEGRWGNGDERERRLKAAGYDYERVQEEVNKMV